MREKATEKLVVWLDPELKRRIANLAKAEGRSVSNMCRTALERVVAANPAVSTSDWVRRISAGTKRVIAEDRKR